VGCFATPCSNNVAPLRHVLEHAGGFEAYFKESNMTAQLEHLYALLRQLGRMPEQSKTEG
jgi:hypothetical protein